MKKLRIFISSPGDVQQERMIAKRVISELSRVYQDYVILEPILWEDLPLEATGSFQEGIDYFLNQSPIDIAVFILWSGQDWVLNLAAHFSGKMDQNTTQGPSMSST